MSENYEALTTDEATARFDVILMDLDMSWDELVAASLNHELDARQRSLAQEAQGLSFLLGGPTIPCCWRCYENE